MRTWRKKALELLPELQNTIPKANNSMSVWIELWMVFEDAFKSGNDDQVERILKYAEYCLKGPSNEVRTAVVCAFLEELPINPKMAEKNSRLVYFRRV